MIARWILLVKDTQVYNRIRVEERGKEIIANEESIMQIHLLLPGINRHLWRNLEINGMVSRQGIDS